ncbi:MAG: DUF1513 domain-containing protein [Granulosicoccus sp.]
MALTSHGLSALADLQPSAQSTQRDAPAATVSSESTSSLFISGARAVDGSHVGVLFDDEARLVATLPLPSRAHGAAGHRASKKAVIFSRRPGYFMSAFTLSDPDKQLQISAQKGRHFYGHGVFSLSGDVLYATENDYDQSRGVLGVYDAAHAYRRLGELETGGIGPHEVIGIPGTNLLVVANGGIETHPDSGRDKLNLDTMQASIALIDAGTGRIVGRHVLAQDMQEMSIRHLAYAGEGKVWFACQYQGSHPVLQGLAGYICLNETMRSYSGTVSAAGLGLVSLPDALQARTQQYLSSVAVMGDSVLYTSSRGGVVFSIDRHTHAVREIASVMDCSGVAAAQSSMSDSKTANNADSESVHSSIVTSGAGDVVQISSKGSLDLAHHRLQWDNHLYRI